MRSLHALLWALMHLGAAYALQRHAWLPKGTMMPFVNKVGRGGEVDDDSLYLAPDDMSSSVKQNATRSGQAAAGGKSNVSGERKRRRRRRRSSVRKDTSEIEDGGLASGENVGTSTGSTNISISSSSSTTSSNSDLPTTISANSTGSAAILNGNTVNVTASSDLTEPSDSVEPAESEGLVDANVTLSADQTKVSGATDDIEDVVYVPPSSPVNATANATKTNATINGGSNETAKSLSRKPFKKLIVSCMTFNLANLLLPPNTIKELLSGQFPNPSSPSTPTILSGSDLIFISTCETEPLKPRRTEGSRSTTLRTQVITTCCPTRFQNNNYTPLAIHSLGGVQAILLVRTTLLRHVTHVHVADVACGVGNVLHNKGGIGVYLTMERGGKSKRMLFVSSHLAAHEGKIEDRNGDFWRIVEALEEDMPTSFRRALRRRASKKSKSSGVRLFDCMDSVFWCGDLNYRLSMGRLDVDKVIREFQGGSKSRPRSERRRKSSRSDEDEREKESSIAFLMKYDQLTRVMKKKQAFVGLSEEQIQFPPTYKLDKRTRGLVYDTSQKRRTPSYTD